MNQLNVPRKQKGRAAVGNREGRFETVITEPFDDGWGSLEQDPPPPPQTTVGVDASRTIINRNTSPDLPFELSVNPYKGCEHGCIYCYARQTHAYLGLSPGLDFETRLFAKPNGPELLEQAMRKRGYEPKPITLGANTDAYQPIERTYEITRKMLALLLEYRNPVAIITKSALVLRDLDLLKAMAELKLVNVIISITTLDPHLARIMEPRAAAPHRRLEVIERLREASVPVQVNAAPMIPAINDMELEAILEASARAGAEAAAYIMVRLPYEVKDLFKDWLASHFPDRAEHVMSLIRQTRDGKEYQADFQQRMRGTGAYAQLMRSRFKVACSRLGLTGERLSNLETGFFRKPVRVGEQLSLFD